MGAHLLTKGRGVGGCLVVIFKCRNLGFQTARTSAWQKQYGRFASNRPGSTRGRLAEASGPRKSVVLGSSLRKLLLRPWQQAVWNCQRGGCIKGGILCSAETARKRLICLRCGPICLTQYCSLRGPNFKLVRILDATAATVDAHKPKQQLQKIQDLQTYNAEFYSILGAASACVFRLRQNLSLLRGPNPKQTIDSTIARLTEALWKASLEKRSPVVVMAQMLRKVRGSP